MTRDEKKTEMFRLAYTPDRTRAQEERFQELQLERLRDQIDQGPREEQRDDRTRSS